MDEGGRAPRARRGRPRHAVSCRRPHRPDRSPPLEDGGPAALRVPTGTIDPLPYDALCAQPGVGQQLSDERPRDRGRGFRPRGDREGRHCDRPARSARTGRSAVGHPCRPRTPAGMRRAGVQDVVRRHQQRGTPALVLDGPLREPNQSRSASPEAGYRVLNLGPWCGPPHALSGILPRRDEGCTCRTPRDLTRLMTGFDWTDPRHVRRVPPWSLPGWS